MEPFLQKNPDTNAEVIEGPVPSALLFKFLSFCNLSKSLRCRNCLFGYVKVMDSKGLACFGPNVQAHERILNLSTDTAFEVGFHERL